VVSGAMQPVPEQKLEVTSGTSVQVATTSWSVDDANAAQPARSLDAQSITRRALVAKPGKWLLEKTARLWQ